ncbi:MULTISPECIES: DNA topoisomerase III [unclassified Pseudoalteromonas]|uniref:DNA topoisomerase III n=1 Tax=unclassified Pseudoalteromonas TaxID=194690 RepID=UPI00209726C3|nr:DNA topoisomerase III [Pseudoalteromonas sp. XMcav2-N]MCO7190324.1 DNA topoisomerase III [Pseudoalteromonas sp. XMcav2-N]
MKLYIAEKPSLGRAIADVLPKPHKKHDGYIELANGDCVTWCIGHLLEQAAPEDYDPKYKKWQMMHLPIVPQQWQFKAKPKTKKQLSVVKKLIKKAKHLVHAGDPDREGQLLVDEVLQDAKLPAYKKQDTQRLLISDLNPSAVKKALTQMRSNLEFVPLSVSALARARADWLYGMNLTRAYTLVGQKAGFQGVLSVGRVQTPVLGLVVRRDIEIENFVSKPFYEVQAHIKKSGGSEFCAKWQPSEACQPYMDEEGRVLVKALADNVASRILDQNAQVKKVDAKPKKHNPPLPYNLSALQIDANKRFGMSAKQVLDVCQALYERHKLITYPRSDNRYLPQGHFAESRQVLDAALNNQGLEADKVAGADLNLKGKCWNDAKVDAHHAIIPTAKKLKTAQLGQYEKQVYQLICTQYLAQFYPAYRYTETKVELEIAGGVFVAKAEQIIDLGFKRLFKVEEKKPVILPQLEVGELLNCFKGQVIEKHTQPPSHFTEATLLSAMTGIARFVSNADIKKVLKETDGLGTEATRAGIIDLLFKRGFLQRSGKSIKSTELGVALVKTLPEDLSMPDRTALWESQLARIAMKEQPYQTFMDPLEKEITNIVKRANMSDSSMFSGLKSGKSGSRALFSKKRTKKRTTTKAGRRKSAA